MSRDIKILFERSIGIATLGTRNISHSGTPSMPILVLICQIIVALGLLNVWLLRFHKSTSYRGGGATSMREEFATYGLPAWSCYLVGLLKVGSAIALLAGFIEPAFIFPAALIVALLMVGAVAMHLKVKDPAKKSVPALIMLALCLVLLAGTWPN